MIEIKIFRYLKFNAILYRVLKFINISRHKTNNECAKTGLLMNKLIKNISHITSDKILHAFDH